MKWKECALNTEQLRSTRWMVGTAPKNCSADLRKCRTVTELSQVLHLKLVTHAYTVAGKRVRASSRPRLRLSAEQSDAMCDYACMFASVLTEAKSLSTWDDEKEEGVLKAFYQQFHGWNLFYIILCSTEFKIKICKTRQIQRI